MPSDLRTAAIVGLVQKTPIRLGKKQMQKLVYFAQHCGMPLQYEYEIYHYGPYSFDLSQELSSLDSLGVLVIDSDPGRAGFDISVGKFAKGFSLEPKYEKKIDKVVSDFGSNTPAELEVKATIHFVFSLVRDKTARSKTKTEVIQKVHALKPRYSQVFIDTCYSNLQQSRWI
jgi:uncharacterized protein YwgA